MSDRMSEYRYVRIYATVEITQSEVYNCVENEWELVETL
jgi:hypothetical protein